MGGVFSVHRHLGTIENVCVLQGMQQWLRHSLEVVHEATKPKARNLILWTGGSHIEALYCSTRDCILINILKCQ